MLDDHEHTMANGSVSVGKGEEAEEEENDGKACEGGEERERTLG